MTSRQVEISSMITHLKQWNKQLGGNLARKIQGSEFDFLQQQFLVKRHQVEKAQDVRENQGMTTSNAGLGYQIREGLQQMGQVLQKLKAQHHRLVKKKKDNPDILQKKKKIVQNCQLLLKDLQERQEDGLPKNKKKVITLTQMKAKLLSQIEENNMAIHERGDSDGKLTQDLEEDKEQIRAWKKKDEQLDVMVDDIIVGVKGLKHKVKNMNEAQDVINQKTKKGVDKADQLGNRIKGDNQKLKKIIEDFKPNRCCLYIALFLLLIGLVVTIIKVLI